MDAARLGLAAKRARKPADGARCFARSLCICFRHERVVYRTGVSDALAAWRPRFKIELVCLRGRGRRDGRTRCRYECGDTCFRA
jgi:hypothetical protein